MRGFKSVLADRLEAFFAYRRQLGFARHPLLDHLKVLDRYLYEQKATADQLQPYFFLGLRASLKLCPSAINHVVRSARALFNFMIRNDYCSENPLKDIPPLPEYNFISFIFSPQQTDALLSAVGRKIRRNPKYFVNDYGVYLVHVLLARCGLRISEPLALLPCHYRRDEATLYIEKTKFRKDRLIPLSAAVRKELDDYLKLREVFGGDDQNPYLLARKKQRGLHENQVCYVFHRAVDAIDIRQKRQIIGDMTFGKPVPHSLRHSFAINTLTQIRARGQNPQHALPVLAAYMGHRKYQYTGAYLKVNHARDRTGLIEFARSQLDVI